MQQVFGVDAHWRPLMPCRPARARLLLQLGTSGVMRHYPITIALRGAKLEAVVEPLRVKIDPDRRTLGIALVNDTTSELVWAAGVVHQGSVVHKALAQRRASGWLPPSRESRIHNILTWVARLRRLCPIGAISFEAVRPDPQLIQSQDICGLEYQQGTLAGMEICEYLLLTWGHRCAHRHREATCWELDHIIPRSRGGSNRTCNLALACKPCSHVKGNRTAAELGHPKVQAQARAPLRDTAAVNSTRRALHQRLLALGLPVETGSGGLIKYSRTQRHLSKAHWLDAACVGSSTSRRLRWRDVIPLVSRSQGHQRHQTCLMDRVGFLRTQPKRQSRVLGCKTGDLVRAMAPTFSSIKAGACMGRVAVRASGAFNLTTVHGTLKGISHRHGQLIQRGDGYSDQQTGVRACLPTP